MKLDALKNVQTASSAQTMCSDPRAIPCHLKETQLTENVAHALDHTGNGGTKDNPILVEEGPLFAATKRQKVELKLNCVHVQTILF